MCVQTLWCRLGEPCMICDHCDCRSGSGDMDAPCALRHPLVPVALRCACAEPVCVVYFLAG